MTFEAEGINLVLHPIGILYVESNRRVLLHAASIYLYLPYPVLYF